ncbi:MFS transporter [Dermabacteraceae bacterium P9123]
MERLLEAAVMKKCRAASRRLSTLSLFSAMADFIFGAVYISLMLNAKFDPEIIGLLFFSTFAISTVFEIPSGDWGDRFGHRKVGSLGLLLWGISLSSFTFALHSQALMLITLTLWSVGQALYSGAPTSLTLNTIPREMESMRQRTVRSASLAKWFGASLGGIAVLTGSIRVGGTTLILCAGIILFILAAWMHFAWEESPNLVRSEDKSNIIRRLACSWSQNLNLLVATVCISSAGMSVLLFTWQPLVTKEMGIDEKFNGLILLGMTSFAGLGAYLAKYDNKFPSHFSMSIPLIVAGALFATVGASPGFWVTLISLAVLEILFSYTTTVLAVRAHTIFPDEARNLLWSAFSAVIGFSMALGDLLFGFLWEAKGLLGGLILAGITISLLAILTGFLWRRDANKQIQQCL